VGQSGLNKSISVIKWGLMWEKVVSFFNFNARIAWCTQQKERIL